MYKTYICPLDPPACGLVLVCSLLGTGPHGQRLAVGKHVLLHLSPPFALPPETLPSIAHVIILPEPPPTPMEKLSSTKLVPSAQKVGDC